MFFLDMLTFESIIYIVCSMGIVFTLRTKTPINSFNPIPLFIAPLYLFPNTTLLSFDYRYKI